MMVYLFQDLFICLTLYLISSTHYQISQFFFFLIDSGLQGYRDFNEGAIKSQISILKKNLNWTGYFST